MKIIARVISGGQTGADIGALRAARKCGLATGGTAPKGFMTELGPRPRLLKGFGLAEHASPDYPARTRANVEAADVTFVLARRLDRGSALTVRLCRRLGRPVRLLRGDGTEIADAMAWLRAARQAHGKPLIVNLAGNRESREPGIEARAEKFLTELFRLNRRG